MAVNQLLSIEIEIGKAPGSSQSHPMAESEKKSGEKGIVQK